MFFKDVAPGISTLVQWMLEHPREYGQNKLDPMGVKRERKEVTKLEEGREGRGEERGNSRGGRNER